MDTVCHILFVILLGTYAEAKGPIVINTWDYANANTGAWESLMNGGSAIDALEAGITVCEMKQCGLAVGFGGNPDANGEVTLDAMLMDGNTMNIGGVAALRQIKNAVGVARFVLENTNHSLIAGSQATDFAVQMGFKIESLTTGGSANSYSTWLNSTCQPNYWVNVFPDPRNSCGPFQAYRKLEGMAIPSDFGDNDNQYYSENNHDTITMLAMDKSGNIGGGSSTNGLDKKIPGRVSDSPIPGAGVYADSTVGAASATGDGDKMMRFLPAFYSVEQMRNGVKPLEAVRKAIARIAKFHPGFWGAMIAIDKKGNYGVACSGMPGGVFPYVVSTLEGQQVLKVKCI